MGSAAIRKIGIHQPNYWPWIGYWRKMVECDVFVLFDDVQLPQGKSYVTRALIKAQSGTAWLTVPVEHKGELKPISEATIASANPWARKHWKTIETAYRRAPYFNDYAPAIAGIYEHSWERIADLNLECLRVAHDLLGISATLVNSSSLGVNDGGTLHIVGIVEQLQGDVYVTGMGAGSARYMDEAAFNAKGIDVHPLTFEHPVYAQQWGEFTPNLSILDFLFNCGREGWEQWLANDKVAAR